jgi:hypothetical protein
MRLALVLTILLLSGYTTGLAATDVTNVPFPSEAQACIDQPPSVSNDPDGFLRCTDIIELASVDRWHAMYVAQHPATKACRDNPPSPSDPSLTSLCITLIDQEDTAGAHYKDKLRVEMGLSRTNVIEHAARKAARKAERLNIPLGVDVEEYIERLDREIAQMEADSRMMLSTPSPPMREPITCTSSRIDSSTYTDCY